MSGIAGIYELDDSPASVEILGQMTRALSHRGPDAVGHWNSGPVALGHCMFYATPESLREVQPLRDQLGDVVITFDGRLDNRDELRSMLHSNGFVPQKDTDVELVLNAYRCWAESCPQQIFGDFAFAIWDSRIRRLFCARDHFGVRPFYYYCDDKRFLFCSEIQPLLRYPTVDVKPNSPFIKQYAEGAFLEKTSTFYRGIYRLPPAHYLEIDSNGRTHAKRYWNVDPEARVRYATSQEYADHFLHLFREAVRCRLRAVGPIGALLSGGIDSSSIVCVAQTLIGEGLASDNGFEAFSAVSNALPLSADGESFDERGYIESVLRMYDLQSNYYYYEDQTSSTSILETARYYRDVLYNPTLNVHASMLEGANRKGVKVLLTGAGGDDILGSDPDLCLYRYADLIKQWKLAELVADIRLALKYYRPLEVSGLFLKHGVNPFIVSLAKMPLRLFSRLSRHEFAMTEPRFSSIFQERIYQSLLQGLNTNIGLEDLDRYWSFHALEARHPFLDVRLVEFVLTIPPENLSRKYQTKLILRRAMKGILPEMIRRRGTKGSASPLVDRELKVVRKEEIQQLLESPTLSEGVDWPYVRRVFANYCDSKLPVIEEVHTQKVVRAIGLELWHRTIIESKGE